MGLGIGRKIKSTGRSIERGVRHGIRDITGQRSADKGREAQKQANLLERKRATLQLTRDKRKLASQARVAQSQLLLNQILSGASGSSSYQGTRSAVGTDVASNIGTAQQDFAFTTAIQQYESEAQRQAGKASEKAGLFSTGIGIASAFSDPRLKEDIHLIGTKNGFNIYSWKWNEHATKELGLFGVTHGVMAHEVAQDFPDAISYERGYMKVNYAMLGLNNG